MPVIISHTWVTWRLISALNVVPLVERIVRAKKSKFHSTSQYNECILHWVLCLSWDYYAIVVSGSRKVNDPLIYIYFGGFIKLSVVFPAQSARDVERKIIHQTECLFSECRPEQNDRHDADDIFKCILLNGSFKSHYSLHTLSTTDNKS